MSEDVQRHAFEPFFTTKAVGEGTGLGLASAHGTVRQAGGHITLQSRPGRGTSFHVYLPRAQRRPATTQEAESRMSRPPASTGKTVLVVDDEPLVRDSVVALLEARGYRVLPAATASEAEAHFAVEQGSVELLITDVRMPACSGIELARRLRDREPGLPVLYISGFNDAAADWGDSGAGRSRSLDKPFTGQQLDDAVRSLLDLTVTSAGQ
jgi:CheY-like chemotaxis protein